MHAASEGAPHTNLLGTTREGSWGPSYLHTLVGPPGFYPNALQRELASSQDALEPETSHMVAFSLLPRVSVCGALAACGLPRPIHPRPLFLLLPISEGPHSPGRYRVEASTLAYNYALHPVS